MGIHQIPEDELTHLIREVTKHTAVSRLELKATMYMFNTGDCNSQDITGVLKIRRACKRIAKERQLLKLLEV